MHDSVKNLISIKEKISEKNNKAKVIAVSKTFSLDKIQPLIDYGHLDFGENKVQEAMQKWSEFKTKNNNINLHLVGKLQTNKVKFALPLFDYIHSLDNLKLASKIHNEQLKKNFKPKIFIQINIGSENQKGGVPKEELKDFYAECKNKFDLNIIGLMAIPPIENVEKYFKEMRDLSDVLTLKELSMGMSGDYMKALNYGASFLRIGTSIFGQRS